MTTAKRFAGRRVLVSGASRGIGAALVERFAAEGADVVGVARTWERNDQVEGTLKTVVEEARRHGTTVEPILADLSSPEDRVGLVGRAAELLGGPIDILINNAAAALYQPLLDYPAKRSRLTFEVNLHAPLDLCQQAAPDMIGRGQGWIVNVSSATARLRPGPPFELPEPGTQMAVYGSAKAALNRLTNGLGAELYGTGVRVNTVEPRFGVLTEGANQLVGELFEASRWESLEAMVEGTLVLCDCDADLTGGVRVSLDLLEERNITVRGLDGARLPEGAAR